MSNPHKLTASHAEEASLSLTQLLNPEVLADPYPFYHRLRTQDPVHWDPFLHAWLITRYDDVVKVLRDCSSDRALGPEELNTLGLQDLKPVGQVMMKQMIFLDAPAHTRLRALASQAFTPRRIKVLRAHIQQIADRLLDDVQGRSHFDVISDLAGPLPAIVSAEFLGLPTDDHRQLKAWSEDFGEVLGNFQHNPDRIPSVLRSVEAMTEYFKAAIFDQHRSPREGLINSFMSAECDGDRFTDEEIVANCIITMVGAQETTTNLIGSGALILAKHPDARNALMNDPTLMPSAVEELLRFESPSHHTARIARADFQLGDKLVRKGTALIAVMAAANRDPERFPEPDKFDIRRKENRHVAFGWGAHFCFGAPLARMEGAIAFETLLRRVPGWHIAPGPLTWRTNLGLRGLESLPMLLNESAAASSERH